MKNLLLSCLAFCCCLTVAAQKRTGILGSGKPIVWLGIDFTRARYIGSATQYQDLGEITSDQMRDKYIPAWNDLFLDQQAKYDVAKYTGRAIVSYALGVTRKANNAIRGKIFSEDPGEYQRLTEEDIAAVVKTYDFGGRTGIGMVFIIEGMSKGKEEAAAWVTFVDMSTGAVLETRRITGAAGGIGFRNYWAKAYLNILKSVDHYFK